MTDIPRFIGMVHLAPLPGAPHAAPLAGTIARAIAEAETLVAAGFDAICIENFGDAPFYPRRVPRLTVAAMTAVIAAVRARVSLPIGVNVLRNDGESALAIAAVVGGAFVRINVLTGAAVTDQGIIEARAHHIARLRASAAPNVRIFADILVKHALPLGGAPDLSQLVHDTVDRAGADAVIVSGSGTGQPVDDARLAAIATAASVPVFIGSGATTATAKTLLRHAHGIIVGTALKSTDGLVDLAKAKAFIAATE